MKPLKDIDSVLLDIYRECGISIDKADPIVCLFVVNKLFSEQQSVRQSVLLNEFNQSLEILLAKSEKNHLDRLSLYGEALKNNRVDVLAGIDMAVSKTLRSELVKLQDILHEERITTRKIIYSASMMNLIAAGITCLSVLMVIWFFS